MGDVSTIQRPPSRVIRLESWCRPDGQTTATTCTSAPWRHPSCSNSVPNNSTTTPLPIGTCPMGSRRSKGGASNELRPEKNIPRSRDVGARGLPEDPWARRFKPRDSAMNRRGDGVGASDGESGTDTVQGTAPKHGRGVSSCVGGNLADKTSEVSGQNFPEDEVHSAAQPSKSCKKRRPASSTAAGSFISMLGDKRW